MLFLTFTLLYSCSKEDREDEISRKRDLQVFSIDGFNRFSDGLASKNFLLNADGSMTIVGNTRVQQANITVQPFILNLDFEKNVSWTETLIVDNENLSRDVNIIPTQDGQFMVLTHANSQGNSNLNIELLKVGTDGNLRWVKTIEQSGDFRTSSIIQLENGDYIVMGRLAEVSLLNSDQFLLVRISENGDIVWSKIYDDSRVLATKQLFYISSDNSIIALTEHSFGDFLTDNEYKIHKFSEDGNKIWTKSIAIAKEPFSSSSLLKVIDGEEVFLSYSSKDERENIHDITLIKLDFEANIIWKKIFKGASTDLPEDILRSDDENLILLSSTYSCGNGEVDIMLRKINPSNQEIIWDKVYGLSLIHI